RYLNALKTTVLISLLLELLSSISYFFIQVGSFSDTGLMGAFEAFFIKLIWNSSVGSMTVLRIMAVLMALVIFRVIFSARDDSNKVLFWGGVALYLSNLLLIGISFTVSGHVSELSLLIRFAIAVHVLIAFWWLGSLWPLVLASTQFKQPILTSIMHKFGQSATLLVVILITAGGYLAVNLLTGFGDLINTGFGQLLSFKLLLVFSIVLLAGYHKFILVPGLLKTNQASQSLASSIKNELIIGIAILTVTAVLTTLVGPTAH